MLLSVFLDATTSSQIDCFLDEQECQIDADNLINFVTEVPTSEECGQLCNDDSTCTAFTHFGADSFPLHEACFLYSSCRERRPCVDCITGSNQADCTCSIEYESYLDGNNLVDFIGSISDEYACKKICASNDMCSVYTFYGPQDKVNPNVCVLLNSAGLQNPVRTCDNCTSGPAQCKTGMECQVAVFFIDGSHSRDFVTDLVLFAKEDYELNFEAKEKNCFVDATFLAIGGGGEQIRQHNQYGGGGSGYIQIATKRLFANSTVGVEVGGSDARSLVQVDGETLITADSGGPGGRLGGDGYCGGGGGGA